MAKIIGVEVVVGGALVACVTDVAEGNVRRGNDPKRPFRWTISHKNGRLQWCRELKDVYRSLATTYPDAKRRIIWDGANPHRIRRKAA